MQSWQIFRMRKQLLPDITALIVMKTSSENGAGKKRTIPALDVFLNKSDEETSPACVCATASNYSRLNSDIMECARLINWTRLHNNKLSGGMH
jgi:hypothetical protein